MMSRLISLHVLLVAAALSGYAQTPSRPEPVPVRLEPRHHNVFENAWVRVLDVRIPPGDTSLMHKHETPSIFIVLSNTKTGSEVIVEPQKIQLTHESIWYESFATSPRIHRVWNSDTSEFHTIDLELPNKNYKPIDPPLDPKVFIPLFDEKPVRGYHFEMGEQNPFSIPARKAHILVVALNDAVRTTSANNSMFKKKGDFLIFDPGQKITFFNSSSAGDGVASFALFEIK